MISSGRLFYLVVSSSKGGWGLGCYFVVWSFSSSSKGGWGWGSYFVVWSWRVGLIHVLVWNCLVFRAGLFLYWRVFDVDVS